MSRTAEGKIHQSKVTRHAQKQISTIYNVNNQNEQKIDTNIIINIKISVVTILHVCKTSHLKNIKKTQIRLQCLK